jgi:hypothetical protein|eukprot:SAG25_NODE_117_length_14819_cov_20.935670_19_plen_65_part_00
MRMQGQGGRPKPSSSTANGWGGSHFAPPQVTRGKANTVTEDSAAWNTQVRAAAACPAPPRPTPF